MKGREIIANAIDLCGGHLVDELPDHTAILHYLNAVADYDLELASSSKGQRIHSAAQTLAANTDTGTFADTTFILRPEFVRYLQPGQVAPTSGFTAWTLLDIVDDISDITEAANRGDYAIMFESVKPIKYRLSWKPDQAISLEIFGKKAGTAINTLDAIPTDFPVEFAQLLAVEVALQLLADVLLLENADKYIAFVKFRGELLYERKKRLRHRWDVYRSNADDASGTNIARDYSVAEDYGLSRGPIPRIV